MGSQLVFLGSSGAIQIPAYFCSCRNCEAARRDPGQRRTRASIALLGQEVTLVDASPDIDFQLEREQIGWVDNIFITHWHYDHIAGLSSFAEPSTFGNRQKIDLYLPGEVVFHFEQELAYLQDCFNLIPTQPGDRFELPDGIWEVVKTTHTGHSTGFIVETNQRFAYLVDGVMPPAITMERLQNLDLAILEATVDELDEEGWFNFSLKQAVKCWKQIGAERCILTHLSCHSWRDGDLVEGLSHRSRLAYEDQHPGLSFAFDGMRVNL